MSLALLFLDLLIKMFDYIMYYPLYYPTSSYDNTILIQYSIFRNQKNTKILRASLFLDQKELEELLSQDEAFYTPPGARQSDPNFTQI